jgi:hypothetical protein
MTIDRDFLIGRGPLESRKAAYSAFIGSRSVMLLNLRPDLLYEPIIATVREISAVESGSEQ